MKKLFQIIGLISLMGFSFFYSEKTVSVVKEYDEIMIEIRKQEKLYKKEPINAEIKGSTIIPGLNGKQININKSYSNMKRYGKFDSSLLVIKKISPKIELNKYKNKCIISGNKNKKMVSLIFIVNEYNSIDKIVSILNKKNIKGNFFVDGNWLEKNSNIVPDLIKENHIVGNLSYNRDYTDSSFNWMEVVIEKIGKQKIGYCYLEEIDKEVLNICKKNDNYTIMPNIIVEKNPYIKVKDGLESGSIISFRINEQLERELPIIINYIESKGYKIENLNNHFEE